MKKIIIFLSVLFGISFLQSCEEIDKPVLDMSATVKPAITSPSTGISIELLKDSADKAIVIKWSPAHYDKEDIAKANYLLQMDRAENNFIRPRDLINTQGTSYSTTVGSFNQTLLGMELMPEEEVSISFRVLSFITRASDYTYAYSEVVTIDIIPYDDIIYVKPIHLLGNATTVGWNNILAREMFHIKDGQFGIVETLTAASGQYIKFISIRGAWAPQWGTDAAGTNAKGNLVYRPTESVPDPPAIPGPTEPGDYRIVADTLELKYTVEKSTTQLYMLGSATSVGWNADAPLQLTRTAPGEFNIVTTLTAGEDNVFKFIEVPGQWAPQYGFESGLWFRGRMVRRATEAQADPPGIAAPSTTGEYLIEVNLGNMSFAITAQ